MPSELAWRLKSMDGGSTGKSCLVTAMGRKVRCDCTSVLISIAGSTGWRCAGRNRGSCRSLTTWPSIELFRLPRERTRSLRNAIPVLLSKRILWILALLVFLTSTLGWGQRTPETQNQRWFEDVTHKAGINSRHHSRRFNNPYAEIMQGYTKLGAADWVGDYDGDGYEDIFVTDSCASCKNHLYRNNGDFTFTDVADAAGVADGNDDENASAAALWLDYNNDGRPDLFVVRFGHSILYENLGNGKFRNVTKAAGLDRYMNAIKAIVFDYDNDGFVDLFIGCYFQPTNLFHPDTPRFFPKSFENANNGGGVIVFHNNRDGTFTDVTQSVGIRTTGWALDLGH